METDTQQVVMVAIGTAAELVILIAVVVLRMVTVMVQVEEEGTVTYIGSHFSPSESLAIQEAIADVLSWRETKAY